SSPRTGGFSTKAGSGEWRRRRDRVAPDAAAHRGGSSQGVPDHGRQPRGGHRSYGGFRPAALLRRDDFAHDATTGTEPARSDPPSVPVAELHRHLPRGADPPLRMEHVRLRRPGYARRRPLLGAGRVRVVRDQVAGAACGFPVGDLDDDVAQPGHDRASVPVLPAPRLGGIAQTAHRACVPRRCVLDLPVATVLPDDPERARGCCPRGRRQRVPDHVARRRQGREAGDRSRGPLPVPLLLERLLRPADLLAQQRQDLDALGGVAAVHHDPSWGSVEPTDGRLRRVHAPGDHLVPLRAEGIHRRHHAHRCERLSPVRVALIGSGWIQDFHARGVLEYPDAQLVAVANHREESARALAERYSIPHVTTDWPSLTEDDTVQAAVIATPNALHAEQAMAFLDAGKHVLVEKPMAVSVEECDAMIDASHRGSASLMVAHCWRFHPGVIAMRDRIASGELGEVVKTRGYGVHAGWGPKGWFVDPALGGGGALVDMGVHAIDTARFVLGDPTPERVCAAVGTRYGSYTV